MGEIVFQLLLLLSEDWEDTFNVNYYRSLTEHSFHSETRFKFFKI